MRAMTAADRAVIVTGKPIGFSIYGADKTLLLAEGYPVFDDFVRQALITPSSRA